MGFGQPVPTFAFGSSTGMDRPNEVNPLEVETAVERLRSEDPTLANASRKIVEDTLRLKLFYTSLCRLVARTAPLRTCAN